MKKLIVAIAFGVYCNLREACAMPGAGSDFSLKDWAEVKIERPGITSNSR